MAKSTDARAAYLPGGVEIAGVLTVWSTASTLVRLIVAAPHAPGLLAEKLAAWRWNAFEPSPGYAYEISATMPSGDFRFELGNPPDAEALRRFLGDFFSMNWDDNG